MQFGEVAKGLARQLPNLIGTQVQSGRDVIHDGMNQVDRFDGHNVVVCQVQVSD